MNHPHYTPFRDERNDWYFTSPIGKHEASLNRELCEEMIAKVRARHIERARREGFEAEILRTYFEGESEQTEEPIPDREYDFARDQEIIADHEATKR